MDSVTQILFGGVVAQAGYRRILGRRATIAGGILGSVPDLDVVAGWIGGPVLAWQQHRGISHAVPVALVYGAALGWLIWRLGRAGGGYGGAPQIDRERRQAWMGLGALACATHPLIDLFTAYGTQLLAPFSTVRFAVNAMPIIDPLYSLPLLAVFLWGALAKMPEVPLPLRFTDRPQRAARLALSYVLLYTLMAWGAGLHMEDRARRELAAAGLPQAAVAAYPTLLQPFWRRLVADRPDEILVGFASPFDARPIRWQPFARQERQDAGAAAAVAAVLATEPGRVFHWFAMDKLHWTVLADAAADNPGGHVVEARDYRYGLPGDSALGFWGLRFRLDAQHRPLGAPERLSERPPPDAGGFRQMWHGLLGR